MKYIFIISAVIIALLLTMLFFYGCNKKTFSVDYCGQKDAYINARDKYTAGEKVEVYFNLIATDTNYSFYLDGESINPSYDVNKGYIIKFTMPEHNVKLKCESKNSMLYYE